MRIGKRRREKTGWGEAADAGGLTPVKDANDVHATFFPPNFTDFQLRRLYAADGAQRKGTAMGVPDTLTVQIVDDFLHGYAMVAEDYRTIIQVLLGAVAHMDSDLIGVYDPESGPYVCALRSSDKNIP